MHVLVSKRRRPLHKRFKLANGENKKQRKQPANLQQKKKIEQALNVTANQLCFAYGIPITVYLLPLG